MRNLLLMMILASTALSAISCKSPRRRNTDGSSGNIKGTKIFLDYEPAELKPAKADIVGTHLNCDNTPITGSQLAPNLNSLESNSPDISPSSTCIVGIELINGSLLQSGRFTFQVKEGYLESHVILRGQSPESTNDASVAVNISVEECENWDANARECKDAPSN